MKILLTGATGYLGSNLAHRLSNKGYQLGCIVRNPKNLGRLETLSENVTLIPVNDLENGIGAFQPELVIHMACTYARGDSSDADVLNGNLFFPFLVMQAVRKIGIIRWINISTCLPPMLNAYALSKYQFAQWGKSYAEKGEFTFVNLLPENFYGVDAPEGNFVSWVIKKLENGEDLDLTLGTQRRDFVYIGDLLRVIEAVLCHPFTDQYTEIEVGTGDTPTIREVVEYLRDITSSESKLNFGAIPQRRGEPDSNCNISSMNQLGITNLVKWRDGMKLLIHNIKSTTC